MRAITAEFFGLSLAIVLIGWTLVWLYNKNWRKPEVLMSFQSQVFLYSSIKDMKDHWLITGEITAGTTGNAIKNISFRIPKGVKKLRLHRYRGSPHVLVDISRRISYPKGFLPNTDKVKHKEFVYPEPW